MKYVTSSDGRGGEPGAVSSTRTEFDGGMDGTSAHGIVNRLRVLVVHDWIMGWGGAERCVEEILRVLPHADVVVGLKSSQADEVGAWGQRAAETWLSRIPGARDHHRWFVPLELLAFATLDTRDYDLVISSSHAFAKAVRVQAPRVHISYCHSPPRWAWDLRDTYWRDARGLQRVAFALGVGVLRRLDRRAAAGVHDFMANSAFVAGRISRYYGRHATIIPPPVPVRGGVGDATRRGEFLLYLGRLVPYKRVDLAILAAERVGVPLVVAGDGPDRSRLERLAGSMTTFTGKVSEEEAGRLLATCRAFVFCAEEDFGIAPVEANAHGAPVIGLARGGLLESMIPGETAEFFAHQAVDDVATAIRRALERDWCTELLVRNARRFEPSVFRRRFAVHVEQVIQSMECGSPSLSRLQ